MFVDVKCEDDTIQIAELINDTEVIFLKRIKSNLYDFEDDITVIPEESICGWYDAEKLEETGIYVKVPGGYDLVDDSEDEDYVCTDEEDSESESESLVDEEDEA
jgi:hypothetical protein